MKRLPFKEVAAAALDDLPGVLDSLGIRHQRQGHELQMINPRRSDGGFGSFSVNANTGVWQDFATDDKGGDVVSLVAYLQGIGNGEACKLLAERYRMGVDTPAAAPTQVPAGRANSGTAKDEWVHPVPTEWLGRVPKSKYRHPGQIVRWWDYQDAEGRLLCKVARFEPDGSGKPDSKDYSTLTLRRDQVTGEMSWRWKFPPAPRPLYRLPALVARPDAPVVICEGEKAADAAVKLLPGHVATCWMGGANAAAQTDFGPLAGRECLLWPDNDDAGDKTISALPPLLQAAGVASFAIVDRTAFAGHAPARTPDDLPCLSAGGRWDHKDDAADAIDYGWTAEHMALLIEAGRLVLTEPAIAAPATGPAPWDDEIPLPVPATPPDTPKSASSRKGTGKPAGKRQPAADGRAMSGNPFKVSDSGLYYQTEDMDTPLWVSSRLDIVALTRDKDGGNWGTLVRFTDPDGVAKELNIPAEQLAGDNSATALKALLAHGLRTGSGPKAKQRLLEYLQRYDGTDRATLVDRLGWHGDAFLMPNGCIGPEDGGKLLYQGAARLMEVVTPSGTLSDWQGSIGRYCMGNDVLTFAVSVAFAGPLMGLASQVQTSGFHFYGDSSQGKTTLLMAACCVFGGRGYMQTWRATDNAFEGMAALYTGGLLALDEIHQCDPRIIGDVIYSLSSDAGKNRSTETGASLRRQQTWRTILLSSGEKSLSTHMAEAGRDAKSGMEVRLVGLRIGEASSGPIFTELHGFPDGAAMSDAIKAAASRYSGTAARAFVEQLVQDRAKVGGQLAELVRRFADEVVPAGAHGQVGRVASLCGLVAAAGEMASMWGITGWPKGAAWQAAREMFAVWLAERGTVGNAEDEAILAKVRLFFESHGESRFSRLNPESEISDYDPTHDATMVDAHAPRVINRCGWRRMRAADGVMEYFVMREAFRQEICAGMDPKRVCRILKDVGALECNRGHMHQWRNPEANGKRMDVYLVTSNLFGGNEHA